MHGATMEQSQNFMEDKINLTANSCDPRPEVDPQRDVSHLMDTSPVHPPVPRWTDHLARPHGGSDGPDGG